MLDPATKQKDGAATFAAGPRLDTQHVSQSWGVEGLFFKVIHTLVRRKLYPPHPKRQPVMGAPWLAFRVLFRVHGFQFHVEFLYFPHWRFPSVNGG